MLLIPGIIASSKFGAVGDFESIQTITIASGNTQAAIEFTSIPSTYQHLQIRALSRTNRADNLDQIYIQFNGDTGSNYTRHFVIGDGSAASSFGEGNQTSGLNIYNFGANTNANIFAGAIFDILDYKDTNKFTTVRTLLGGDRNGAGFVTLNSNLWRSTSAVTSIKFTALGSFVGFTHFALYGIKG